MHGIKQCTEGARIRGPPPTRAAQHSLAGWQQLRLPVNALQQVREESGACWLPQELHIARMKVSLTPYGYTEAAVYIQAAVRSRRPLLCAYAAFCSVSTGKLKRWQLASECCAGSTQGQQVVLAAWSAAHSLLLQLTEPRGSYRWLVGWLLIHFLFKQLPTDSQQSLLSWPAAALKLLAVWHPRLPVGRAPQPGRHKLLAILQSASV